MNKTINEFGLQMYVNLDILRKIHLYFNMALFAVVILSLLYYIFGGEEPNVFGIFVSFFWPFNLPILLYLYFKGAYHYIWKYAEKAFNRAMIAFSLPALLLVIGVCMECIFPSITGPMTWASTMEFQKELWLGSWRFWWMGVLLKVALVRANIILYILLFIRYYRRM